MNIASRSVEEALDSLVLSNSVRMGVVGPEKTLSKEFAPAVRANAVLPGPHGTARIQELVDDAVDRGEYDSYDERLQGWAGNPLERIGDPMEFGNTVAFLRSPDLGFIDGIALPIDGGSTGANLRSRSRSTTRRRTNPKTAGGGCRWPAATGSPSSGSRGHRGHSSPIHDHENEQVCLRLEGELTVATRTETVTLEHDSVLLESNDARRVENTGDELAVGVDVFAPGRSFDLWTDRDE